MILPIYAALDHMDPALIEAGKDLYGTPCGPSCMSPGRYWIPAATTSAQPHLHRSGIR